MLRGCPDGKLSYVERYCSSFNGRSASAASGLTYLNCVIKETLRMRPPVGTCSASARAGTRILTCRQPCTIAAQRRTYQ